MSVLIITDGSAILFDAGTGVRRLADSYVRESLANVSQLHVVFSHFHYDHTGGFTWLMRLWPGEIVVHAPSSELVELDGVEALNRVTSPPLFAAPLDTWEQLARLETFGSDGFDAGDLHVQCIRQHHSGGSVGFRVGRFAYITDTEATSEHGDFIAGCDLVLMDTMHDSEDFSHIKAEDDGPAQHGWSHGNAQLAESAGVSRLGLVHVDPLYGTRRLANLLAESQRDTTDVFFPEEGTEYAVAE